LAPEDPRAAIGRPRGELGEQPALADPGLAADERDNGRSGGRLLDGRQELPELSCSPGEDPAREALRHGASIPA